MKSLPAPMSIQLAHETVYVVGYIPSRMAVLLSNGQFVDLCWIELHFPGKARLIPEAQWEFDKETGTGHVVMKPVELIDGPRTPGTTGSGVAGQRAADPIASPKS